MFFSLWLYLFIDYYVFFIYEVTYAEKERRKSAFLLIGYIAYSKIVYEFRSNIIL